jgi:hypothetical protein
MVAEGMYVKRHCPIILLLITAFFGSTGVFGQTSLGPDGSNVDALHSIGLTGTGVNVGLLSARNVSPDHQAFYKSAADHNSRVVNSDFSDSGVNYTGGTYPGHDTWVAGIIASRGWTGYTTALGAAPACNIYSARIVTDAGETYISDLIDAFNTLIDDNDCRVFVLPLQYSGTADANSSFSKLVDYYAYEKNVVLALASGNDYSYPTIFGDAYNGITTGGLMDACTPGIYSQVGTKSNPGPTVDGRNKPDITAPASRHTTASIGTTTAAYITDSPGYLYGATSFSCAQTAGVAALLLQYADSTSDPCDGRNTVIKAVIVNSTFPNIRNKTGGYTSPATSVWNAHRGCGRIDAFAAYEILSAGKITKSVATSAQKGWAHNKLSGNRFDTYRISAEKKERLVLTITWNREVAYYFDAESGPFNINLLIKDPSDANVYTETATLNNLIKIDLPLTSTGQYKVIIKNMTNKDRPYALAFERLETLAGDLNSDFVVNCKDLKQLATDWLNTGTGTVSDIVQDSYNRVNNLDYCKFANDWLDFDSRYYTP